MKKVIWILPLVLSQAFLQAAPTESLDQNQAAFKIQRAWLKSKGLLKSFYFKDDQNEMLSYCSVYKINRLKNKIKKISPVLYNQIIGEWQDNKSIVFDDMPKEAVPYLFAYINSYGSINQSNIEKAIIECPYVLDILYFAHKYQLEKLEDIILQNIASLASKHNLYTKLSCENLEQIIDRLNLNPDVVRKSLEKNKKYFPEILKSSVKKILVHDDSVKNIVFSNDNRYLASCSSDGKVKLYNLETQQLVGNIIIHDRDIYRITFSNDSKFLASCSSDGKVKFYNLETKQLMDTVITFDHNVKNIVFSNDNKYLASCSLDGKVKLYDLETKKLIGDVITHNGWVNDIAFSNDSKYLASCSDSDDEIVKLYDLEKKHLICGVIPDDIFVVNNIAFSNDSRYLASCSFEKVDFYDLETQQLIDSIIIHNNIVSNISFSNDNRYLALWLSDSKVKLYNLETQQLIDPIITHNGWVNLLSFSNDSRYLALCLFDGKVNFYDLEAKQLIGTVITHNNRVNNIAFSNNNKYLASCSRDGAVKLAGDTSHMSNKEIFDIVEKIESTIIADNNDNRI